MNYIKLSTTTTPQQAESLSEALTLLGALSVSFQDAGDESLFQIDPNATPLWQQTQVDALFDNSISIDDLRGALNTQHPSFAEFSIEKIEEQNWVRITQQQFQPQQYGENLWICPSWEETSSLEGTVVRIDPGLAFGTGGHPTTALCLKWLAGHPPKEKRVIDYGCGSGILALASLALDAKKVWAIDHDPQALMATENNAKQNAFYEANNLIISLPENCSVDKVDLVIANILANPLIELAPLLIRFLTDKGTLILSGLLEKESDRVCAAYADLQLIDKCIEQEWVRLVFKA